MQIHELTTIPSPTGNEFIPVDNGTATYKMKTLFGLISSTVMKIFGSLIVDSGLGTGNRSAYNDTEHNGTWVTSGGEIHMAQESRGGTIGFHFGRSASATVQLYEGTSGILTNTGRLVTKDWTETQRTPVSSATSDGGRVGWMQGMANAVRVSAQWGTAGAAFSTKDIAVSTSDLRLKEHIKDSSVKSLPIIKNIKLREFDWKDGRHQDIGVIADELQELDPAMAIGGGVNEDGTDNYKSIDTLYLVSHLINAVQELTEQVERLEARS